MKVSIWAGSSPSWEVLDAALTFSFTDDGDAIPCQFCRAFGIDWFDDDYREASHSSFLTSNIGILIIKHSDGNHIIRMLGHRVLIHIPCNSIVLLYDFEYPGIVRSAIIEDHTRLIFVGCVEVPFRHFHSLD